jgi:hypothetical protein
LIKAVEVQLLSSDLSTSVVPSPAQRAALTTVNSARDKAVLSKGGARKAGVLVQLLETDDIAHSAGQGYEVLKDKREYRRVLSRGGKAGEGGRIMDLGENDEQDEDEMKKAILQGGKEPVFQRGSGKMKLSDGETQFMAFELKRIVGLGSEEVKLGTKVRFFNFLSASFPSDGANSAEKQLLLHDVLSVNGVLMLTPQNTTVKGYQVEEFEQVAEWQLENVFRRRLECVLPSPLSSSIRSYTDTLTLKHSMEPLPHPDLERPAADPNDNLAPKPDDDDDVYMQVPPPPPPRQPSAPRQPVATTSRTKPAPSSSSSKPKPKPKSKPARASSEEFDDDFDYDALVAQGAFDDAGAGGRGGGGIDEDEEEAMRAMMDADFGGPPALPPARRVPPPAQPKRPPPPSKPSSRTAVKPEPSSSSSHTAQARSSTLSGTVEVLELDSSSDEEGGAAKENSRPAPPAKKAKVVATRVKEELSSQAAGGARGGGRTVTMLELDDSD